jgi:poly-gamma-glutamate synthesis protein (capsule biosynthesis protein)
MKPGVLLLIVAVLLSCGGGRRHAYALVGSDSIPKAEENRLTLLFAGDMMQHQGQIDAARTSGGGFDYSRCFELIAPQVAAADVAICNFEAPLGGAPYSGYPAFCCPDEFAIAVRNAGFGIFLTANNHCLDKGARGLKRTINRLDEMGVSHLGTYLSPSARDSLTPFIIEKNGIRVALLNYTYGTNGLTVSPPCTVNYIDTTRIVRDLELTRAASPDIIVACIHWGIEYELMPSGRQRRLVDWLYSKGVRYVIGGHPHVVQPMEYHSADDTRSERLVVYSLGNAISNMSATNTDGGALFSMTLQKDSVTHIVRCGYTLVWTERPALSGRRLYRLCPAYYPADSLSTPALRERFRRYVDATRRFFTTNNKGVDEDSVSLW